MKIRNFLMIVTLLFAFSACNEVTKTVDSKPSSSGSTLEMVVVTDNDTWKSSVGTTIKDYFGQEQPGLGQIEPMFDVRQLPFTSFNELFQKHRNLLIVEINKGKKKRAIYKADVWSQPQFVVKLIAPNTEKMKELLDEEKEKLSDLYYLAERKRIIKAYRNLDQKDLTAKIERKMNISMVVPKGFYIAKLEEDFVWLRREPAEMSHGIMIYTQPYVDTMQFNPDRILNRRDSVTKKYIPGPLEGSYMATERIFRPYTREMKYNKQYAVEVRGLWKTENYQMGGPFLNITTFDKKNNRLVTLDGFVYHPNKPKRNYLMQLDAIIHSVEFLGDEKPKNEVQEQDQ